MLHHRQVGGEKHPLQLVFLIQGGGKGEDLQVGLGGGAHDELGGLPRRGEPGRVAVLHQLLLALGNAVPQKAHGGQNVGLFLVGRQQLQACFRGQLDVDAHAVGQQTQLGQQSGAGPGDGLGVDVAVELILPPEDAQSLQHQLAGVVGGAYHRAGQKQALDIVAAVKLHGEVGQLPGGEGGPFGVVGAAVDAIGAVIAAGVALQYLQQGDAPPVGGKAVAAAAGHGGPQPAGAGRAVQPAGGAGRVIFGGGRQNGQFVQHIHRNVLTKPNKCSHIQYSTYVRFCKWGRRKKPEPPPAVFVAHRCKCVIE